MFTGLMFAMIGMAMNMCLAKVHVCGASFPAIGRRKNGYHFSLIIGNTCTDVCRVVKVVP